MCNNNGQDITFYQADCDVLSTINKDWLTKDSSIFYNYKYREIMCKTLTIDKLIEYYVLPDLIKIDVEGGGRVRMYCIINSKSQVALF